MDHLLNGLTPYTKTPGASGVTGGGVPGFGGIRPKSPFPEQERITPETQQALYKSVEDLIASSRQTVQQLLTPAPMPDLRQAFADTPYLRALRQHGDMIMRQSQMTMNGILGAAGMMSGSGRGVMRAGPALFGRGAGPGMMGAGMMGMMGPGMMGPGMMGPGMMPFGMFF